MPDRIVLSFPRTSSVASNFDYTTVHQRVVVTRAGTIRGAYAHAQAVTSNATHPSKVDFYLQGSGPALGSNTAVSILTTPITVSNTLTSSSGTIRHATARVTPGDMIELRTSVNASDGELTNVGGSIEIEVDR